MTARHYAPAVPVELFDTKAALAQRYAELRRQGKRVAMLQPHAPQLFADLRRLEAEGVDAILCVLPPATGLGLAVRDRLRRAAGLAGKQNAG
jgi:hypothetical protein